MKTKIPSNTWIGNGRAKLVYDIPISLADRKTKQIRQKRIRELGIDAVAILDEVEEFSYEDRLEAERLVAEGCCMAEIGSGWETEVERLRK